MIADAILRELHKRLIVLGAAIIAQRHWGEPIPRLNAEKQDDAIVDLGLEARKIADALSEWADAQKAAPPAAQPVGYGNGDELDNLVTREPGHIVAITPCPDGWRKTPVYTAAPAEPGPAGFVLAPVEPTRAMLLAVSDMDEDKYLARGRAVDVWKRMLAAVV